MIDEAYNLRLYVSGETPKSARAIENLRRICDEHLAARLDLRQRELRR